MVTSGLANMTGQQPLHRSVHVIDMKCTNVILISTYHNLLKNMYILHTNIVIDAFVIS